VVLTEHSWDDGYQQISVDLTSLASFAKTLRDEVDLNFAPHMQRVIGVFDPRTKQDPLPSRPEFQEMKATRDRYAEAWGRAISMMDKYRLVTLEIAAAAEAIEQAYRGSDAYSRAQVAQVTAAFDAAHRTYGGSGE
jgi:hypothetical protein